MLAGCFIIPLNTLNHTIIHLKIIRLWKTFSCIHFYRIISRKLHLSQFRDLNRSKIRFFSCTRFIPHFSRQIFTRQFFIKRNDVSGVFRFLKCRKRFVIFTLVPLNIYLSINVLCHPLFIVICQIFYKTNHRHLFTKENISSDHLRSIFTRGWQLQLIFQSCRRKCTRNCYFLDLIRDHLRSNTHRVLICYFIRCSFGKK